MKREDCDVYIPDVHEQLLEISQKIGTLSLSLVLSLSCSLFSSSSYVSLFVVLGKLQYCVIQNPVDEAGSYSCLCGGVGSIDS